MCNLPNKSKLHIIQLHVVQNYMDVAISNGFRPKDSSAWKLHYRALDIVFHKTFASARKQKLKKNIAKFQVHLFEKAPTEIITSRCKRHQ